MEVQKIIDAMDKHASSAYGYTDNVRVQVKEIVGSIQIGNYTLALAQVSNMHIMLNNLSSHLAELQRLKNTLPENIK